MIGFPKPRPRALDKQARQRDREAHVRQVNAAVDMRDGKRCRCCGRRGDPNATTTLGRIHRAHIQDASCSGAYELSNLCSLCWICHALEHAKQLWFAGEDANDLAMPFEIHEAAVVEIFGARPLPAHVHIITDARSSHAG